MKRFTYSMLLLVFALEGSAKAGIVTLDFNSAPSAAVSTVPYLEKDFRIQVSNCHYDLLTPGGLDGTQWMGFDSSSGCVGNAKLRLDFFGEDFDLLSLDVISPLWKITSSKGGIASPVTNGPDFSVVGALWNEVNWIDFETTSIVGGPTGFDNIDLSVISVAEPSVIFLIAIGALSLYGSRLKQGHFS